MKNKFLKLLTGMLIIPLFFGGCQRENLTDPVMLENLSLKNGVVVNYCGETTVLDLVAGKTQIVGTVTIGNDDENIFVTFEVTGDWWLANTKVFLGTDAAQIPVTKTGNPIRGKFTQDITHNPYVKSFTHVFPMGDFEPGDVLVIAAHSTVIILEEIEGEMVIVRDETAWGDGGNAFTGKAWGWWATYTIQQCPVCPDHVIIFKNADPWYTDDYNDILEDYGFTPGTGPGTYEYATSADMGLKVLNPLHDLVIIVNDQPQGFYDALAANEDYFYDFVEDGGNLLFGATDDGWNSGDIGGVTLPEGILSAPYFASYNLIPDPTLPLVAGLTSPLWGSAASHRSFTNLPAGSIVYCTDDLGDATLFEFNLGLGKIMMTGQTLEFGYYYGQGVGPLFMRILGYMTCNEFDMTAVPAAVIEGETPLSYKK